MQKGNSMVEVSCSFVAEGFSFDVPGPIARDRIKLKAFLLEKFFEYMENTNVDFNVIDIDVLNISEGEVKALLEKGLNSSQL